MTNPATPKLSKQFRDAIKLNGPAYRIAQRAHIHPTTLSKLLHGYERVRPNDPRVISIGRLLGLSAAECFASSDGQILAFNCGIIMPD